MLHRFSHDYESEIDDAQEEIPTSILQEQVPCVGTPPMAGMHAKSAQVCIPIDKQVVGHLCPHVSKAKEVDLELDDAKNELSMQVLDTRGDDLPHKDGHKAIAPKNEPVKGCVCPLFAYDIDRDLDDLLHEAIKGIKQAGKMDREQVQVADVSPVMRGDMVDISMVMEPVVEQAPFVDGTCFKDASGSPCVVTLQ